MNRLTNSPYPMLILIFTLVLIRPVDAAVSLGISEPQVNRSAAIYQFDVYAQNDMPSSIVILSFDLPFDLGGDNIFDSGADPGFNYVGFSTAGNSDGEFSTIWEDTTRPFWDVLVSGSATGTDEGLPLQPGERKKLFSIQIESDGTAIGDVLAATLIRTGVGAQFGRFNIDDASTNIYASGLTFSGGLTLTSIPEPSSLVAIGTCGMAILIRRRR